MFDVITKSGEYTLVDQKKQADYTYAEYEEALDELVESWQRGDTPYLSLIIDPAFETKLLSMGFSKTTRIVEHERKSLSDLEGLPSQPYVILAFSAMSDEEFGEYYEACKSGSANKNQLFTTKQLLESLHLELGNDWRKLVMLFQEKDEFIGLAIPHIEAGTISEGRLFYFGMKPNWRGKGKTTACHAAALKKLHELGATTYVGSTDIANEAMIHVMDKNGASERDCKGIYKLTRKDLPSF
ncbi:GNAT family protein [Chryseomicrobium sp. FSL W7-1435]|uniref:GNAT family N-acetyltransferase n=1 Tax=Chryseomicrobium sp. FSL W7-1435 TaxID=2921704 RepID=UPI00315A41A8